MNRVVFMASDLLDGGVQFRCEDIDAWLEEHAFVVAGDVVDLHAPGEDFTPAEIAGASKRLLRSAEEDQLAVIRTELVMVDGNVVDVIRTLQEGRQSAQAKLVTKRAADANEAGAEFFCNVCEAVAPAQGCCVS